MRNLDRESFFEALKEHMTEISELYNAYSIPNFECYVEDDNIQDEEIKRITEIFRDASDVVERNI